MPETQSQGPERSHGSWTVADTLLRAPSSALAVMRALRTLGLTVPGDVSVVGLGDLRLNEKYDPPLTSVRLFPEEIGPALDFLCVHLYPDGYATLDVGPTPAVVDRFKRLDRLLKAA